MENRNDNRPGGAALTGTEEELSYLMHELQTPLRKISGFAGLLAELPGANPKAAHYTGRILAGAERMEALISAYNRYSFAVAQPAEPAQVDLAALAAKVLRDLKPEIDKAGGTARSSAAGLAVADPQKTAAIIRELVLNALKFRGGRPPVVRISARKAGPELVVSVSDNGIGIAAEDAGKLFDLFRRLLPAGGSGAGVGLALCRRLAGQCGGRVWLRSKPGKGTVFYLALPAREDI